MPDTEVENHRFDIYASLINRFGAEHVNIAEKESHRRGLLI